MSAPIEVREEPPGSSAGRFLRTAYWHDVADLCGLEGDAGTLPPGDEETLVAPRGTFLVASADGTDLGCVGVRFLDGALGRAELKRLYVAPAARGLRLGRRLLDEAHAWALARGAREVVLDTRSELTAALRLYASAGYVEVEPYNDNPQAQVWMARSLDGPVAGRLGPGVSPGR